MRLAMPAPPSIPLADVSEKFGGLIINGLAVAGAGLIGYFVTLLLVWLVGKAALNRKVPTPLRRILCVVGGVAAALAVYAMLFHGGGGHGGGGWGLLGSWLGFGKSELVSTELKPQATHPEVPPRTESQSHAVAAEAAAPLRILMLGGERVKGSSESELTYYQLQPEERPLNLAQVKDLIRERKKAKPPLHEIVIMIQGDSVARGHLAVKQLADFASDEGLAISYQVP
jgi:hypothetical protein